MPDLSYFVSLLSYIEKIIKSVDSLLLFFYHSCITKTHYVASIPTIPHFIVHFLQVLILFGLYSIYQSSGLFQFSPQNFSLLASLVSFFPESSGHSSSFNSSLKCHFSCSPLSHWLMFLLLVDFLCSYYQVYNHIDTLISR